MKKKATPVAVKGMSFHDIVTEAQKRNAEEERKFKAMTPEQQKEYIAEREKEEKELQEILKDLPGLVRIQL